MSFCQFKKGIFIQRACHASAHQNCTSCGIYVCADHAEEYEGKIHCLDCYLKINQPVDDIVDAHYYRGNHRYSMWYASSRYHYYHSYHQAPFDQSDYQGFTETAGADFDGDLDSNEDFFDS